MKMQEALYDDLDAVLCLSIGTVIGFRTLPPKVMKYVDRITTSALIILMFTIGASIGVNESLIVSLGRIGFQCVIISLSAIFFSILFTVVLEKTILPLEEVRKKVYEKNLNVVMNEDCLKENSVTVDDSNGTSPLIWIIPISIIVGVFFGYLVIPSSLTFLLSLMLLLSLILLYTSVGIGLGTNRSIFLYIKVLGWKIILLSIAIFIGSLIGGLLAGIILKMPLHISTLSASGMSYYSLTGAYMSQVFGIEAGTYGFIVNVLREFFTVLALPFFIRISKGSTIAAGAAGNMDTMLVPVTRFVGKELGLVTLITGTILTFAVPFILPLLTKLFQL